TRSAWGQPQYNPPSRFLDEIPASLLAWEREEPTRETMSRWERVGEVGGGTGSAQERLTSSSFAPSRRPGVSGAREVPVLDVGDRVTHDTFGMGSVVGLRGTAEKQQAEVDFGAGTGRKWLLLRYAPIQKL
ncbi:MAG TPA: ATP-dependent DNA helicase PcrA, partial [Mycobacteriales bacterium]